MEIGIYGLGRMGGNMATRLAQGGHRVVASNRSRGPVDEAVKWGLLRGAFALVSPSAFESFSIVLLEAWSVGTPALVNSRCAVTLDHARRSGGGVAFGNYAELEVELDRLTDSAPLRAALGRAGQAYVDAHYHWDDVLDRYSAFVSGVGARSRRRA